MGDSARTYLVAAGRRVPAHQAAERFPLIEGADLEKLVEDVRAHGLRVPVLRDAAGEVLLDGRNRLAACERGPVGSAGVCPSVLGLALVA